MISSPVRLVFKNFQEAEEAWGGALSWATSFEHCMVFSDNNIPFPQGAFPKMIMAGAKRIVKSAAGNAFNTLKQDRSQFRTWLCGYLSYDLKNEIEDLESKNQNLHDSPDLYFFEPEHVLIFHGDSVIIESHLPVKNFEESIFKNITPQPLRAKPGTILKEPDREQYTTVVERIREHILDGDIYEMNYCIEFGFQAPSFQPLHLFNALTAKSPTPFACLAKLKEHVLICASPERFLRKSGDTLLSQPIKGTARSSGNPEEDEGIRNTLLHSEKERAENMMIVDLVRNDLARSSKTGTVQVPELFGIYSFRHLHQMISSVTSRIRPDIHPVDALRNAFPMGSMTGAPKVKVMQLIEQYESSQRGIYSGAAGFFSPNDDFDFNVVIRSLVGNSAKGTLSFSVGSAITFDSQPGPEYDECLLKAHAIFEVLRESGLMPEEWLNKY